MLREYQQRQNLPLDFWEESSSSPESESAGSNSSDSDLEISIPEKTHPAKPDPQNPMNHENDSTNNKQNPDSALQDQDMGALADNETEEKDVRPLSSDMSLNPEDGSDPPENTPLSPVNNADTSIRSDEQPSFDWND